MGESPEEQQADYDEFLRKMAEDVDILASRRGTAFWVLLIILTFNGKEKLAASKPYFYFSQSESSDDEAPEEVTMSTQKKNLEAASKRIHK